LGLIQPVDFFGTGPRIPMIAVAPFSQGPDSGLLAGLDLDVRAVIDSAEGLQILRRSARTKQIRHRRNLCRLTPFALYPMRDSHSQYLAW
jgi:hypothetical protein